MILKILFWLSVFALAYSYVIYPFVLQLIVLFRGEIKIKTYAEDSELPTISILMAAYNEEQIVEKKIRSIFNTTYPLGKMEVFVASDNSTDATNRIINNLSEEYENLTVHVYTERQGKINIINRFSDIATGEIVFITDANVLFEKNTIWEVVKYFADTAVGLVDTNMKNYGIKKNGISFQEKSYISREVRIKHLETLSFGNMIGPFGGCYALRKDLFIKVPSTYLVDDFFICMNVLAQNKLTVNNLNAIVYEDVSNSLAVEFKRKIRIAMGNFQNLKHFAKQLWPLWSALGFSFFSHKVLRWFGPFFLLLAFVANLFLWNVSELYQLLFVGQIIVTSFPLFDFFLKRIGVNVVVLRFATHFYSMNLSLLIGFYRWLRGVKTSVWKPTARFQE